MLHPGMLVVKRVRWKVDANQVGIIVSRNLDAVPTADWLVMWSSSVHGHPRLRWHVADALLVVGSDTLEELRKRCTLVT